MNEEGGEEETVMVVTSDGVRGAEVNDDSGDVVRLCDQDVKEDDDNGVGRNDDGVEVNDGGGVEVEQDDQDGKRDGLGDDLGVGMDGNDQSDQSDTGRKWSEIVTGVANDGVMGAEVINDSKEGAELGDQDERMKIMELELG